MDVIYPCEFSLDEIKLIFHLLIIFGINFKLWLSSLQVLGPRLYSSVKGSYATRRQHLRIIIY